MCRDNGYIELNVKHLLIINQAFVCVFLSKRAPLYMNQYYELYRRSTLGIALTEALDELIQSGHMTPQLAMRVLNQFDKAVADHLTENVRARVNFKGSLGVYRFCDDVWTFMLKNTAFRFENDALLVDRVKIVACNAKKPGEA